MLDQLTCACLAAGLSSRMRGEHKLAKLLHGKPVLLHTLEQLDSLPFGAKLLVLGHEAASFQSLAQGFTTVMNPNFRQGLHSSIRAAVLATPVSSDALLIVLADQPFDLAATIETFFARVGVVGPSTLARAWHRSTPGHPVLVGRNYFERVLAEPDGDYGCAYLFKENPFQKIELPETVLWDLDTPEQFDTLTRPSAPSSRSGRTEL